MTPRLLPALLALVACLGAVPQAARADDPIEQVVCEGIAPERRSCRVAFEVTTLTGSGVELGDGAPFTGHLVGRIASETGSITWRCLGRPGILVHCTYDEDGEFHPGQAVELSARMRGRGAWRVFVEMTAREGSQDPPPEGPQSSKDSTVIVPLVANEPGASSHARVGSR